MDNMVSFIFYFYATKVKAGENMLQKRIVQRDQWWKDLNASQI